jgi:hypothetical protein
MKAHQALTLLSRDTAPTFQTPAGWVPFTPQQQAELDAHASGDDRFGAVLEMMRICEGRHRATRRSGWLE